MARIFNAGTDKINFGSNTTLAPNNLSVSLWAVNPGTGSSFFTIVNRTNTRQNGEWSIASNSSNSWRFSIFGGGANTNAFDLSTTVCGDGKWHNLVATVPNASATLTCYTDGAVSSGGSGQQYFASTNATTCQIGGTAFGLPNAMNPGTRVADLAIWNVQLTAGEAAALANGARPYTIRPLNIIGYWPLDGLQSPEPDFSGNGFNGTLTGTALSAGPPVMQFTPRWPRIMAIGALAATSTFRRTLSSIGTRTGSRQAQAM